MRHFEQFIGLFMLWVFTQVVAWFYGGKTLAGWVALVAGLALLVVFTIIASEEEKKDV
jgi:hypothetical protein